MDSITRRFAAVFDQDEAPPETVRPGLSGIIAWLSGQDCCRHNPVCTGLAAAVAILLSRHLRFDAADPGWADRDRVVVSPGLAPLAHAAGGLAGAAEALADTLPDPPGQSLGAAVGLAMAERQLAARFGRSLVDHRTWVLAAVADLSTGLAQEAAHAAAAQRLGRLAVLAAVQEGEPLPAGFGPGWTIRRAAAGDEAALQAAISAAIRSHKPTLVACVTTQPCLPWPAAAALAPCMAGNRGAGARRAWLRRLARHTAREEFERTLAARLPVGWHKLFSDPGPLLVSGQARIAPSAASRQAFSTLSALLPELVCLSAEPVAGEMGRNPSGAPAFSWHMSVQALACAAGGMARHRGIIPISTTRLSDSASLGPGLRSAAQSGLRVIHVVTEPAAGCPTAGHRAALRAMRNVFVLRPADAAETLECAELAMRRTHGPSVLLLSEIACAPLTDRPTRTRCVHGGFLVREPERRRDATIIASGAELAVALRAHDLLAADGIATAVVSLPCWELFANQDASWRENVLGSAPRVGVEAGSGFGWERWLGDAGVFIGSDAAGSPAGLGAGHIVAAVTGLLGQPERIIALARSRRG